MAAALQHFAESLPRRPYCTDDPHQGQTVRGRADALIGEWGVTEILANPYAAGYYEKGDVQIRILHTMDAVVRQPKAFVVADDLTL